PSLCPDCGSALLARRGPVVVWHWAHRAGSANRAGSAGCHHRETDWHLTWKAAYHSFPGWEVETLVEASGRAYPAGARNVRSRRVREFVHSLSDAYVAKHLALAASEWDVLWIFDGDTFVAQRRRPLRSGAVKHLLKPRARWLHGRTGGLVHWAGRLWREW